MCRVPTPPLLGGDSVAVNCGMEWLSRVRGVRLGLLSLDIDCVGNENAASNPTRYRTVRNAH